MRRNASIILITLLAILLTVSPASAVLDGQPDGNRHPYVGLVTNGVFVCSGAAISPTVFVTAAHCFDVPGEAVEVTFDPDGFAPDSIFYSGNWYPHPDFCIACAPGLPGFDTHDVAVVVFDEPVSLPQYARLPRVGLVDTLAMKTPVTVVGYGVQDRLKDLDPDELFTREFGRSLLIQSNDVISDEFIKLLASPSHSGSCFGDSGGPNLLRNTDIIIGINSFVTNSNCAGVTYSQRVDLPDILRFIRSFL